MAHRRASGRWASGARPPPAAPLSSATRSRRWFPTSFPPSPQRTPSRIGRYSAGRRPLRRRHPWFDRKQVEFVSSPVNPCATRLGARGAARQMGVGLTNRYWLTSRSASLPIAARTPAASRMVRPTTAGPTRFWVPLGQPTALASWERRSKLMMRAPSSGPRNGLLTKSSAPAANASTMSQAHERAVRNRTGRRQ